jgi:hypothetical protein
MRLDENDLKRAAAATGLSAEQAQALWKQLQERSETEAHFEPAHVAYYLGALLVIGAMGWFMTNGWDSFSGVELFAIAAGYAVVFLAAAQVLW